MTLLGRTRLRHHRRVLAAATIVVAGWMLAVPTARATVGAPVRAGDATVVEAGDGSRELIHGGSAAKFSLRLPDGSSCPGDSANDQWRVQSFIVPATDDPGTLRYTSVAPAGDGRYALYDVETHPLINSLTQQNLQPGEPGVIPAIPPLSFAVFPPGTLPSGRYRIGIACTLFRETAIYWDTEIVLTASPDDEPAQLVWRLPNVPESINDSGGGSRDRLAQVSVGALVVVLLGALWWHRKFRRPRTPPNARQTLRRPKNLHTSTR